METLGGWSLVSSPLNFEDILLKKNFKGQCHKMVVEIMTLTTKIDLD
jgi:hypothetical protein